MDCNTKEEVYLDWLNKWRKWRDAWCISSDVVVEFCIQFIPVNIEYTPNDYAELCHQMNESLGRSKIGKDGVLTIRSSTQNECRIRILHKCKKFHIITLGLDMFTRKDILLLSITLENMGHGVIHDGGFISNTFDIGKRKYKMPNRDDPVWDFLV